MTAGIDRSPVHEDEVLVQASAPDAEAGGPFTGRLDTRHHLDDADDIGLSHEGGHFSDDGGVHPLQAHLGKADLVPLGAGKDSGRFQFILVCFQFEIQTDIFFCRNGDLLGYVSEIGTGNSVLSHRNREGIKTYAIGGDARFMVFQEYNSLLERLSGFGIPDIAGNRIRLDLGMDETREQKENCSK